MKEQVSETIGAVFSKCQDVVLSLDTDVISSEAVQKNIETTIKCLRDLKLEVTSLDLFSENEDLDDVQTGHLKFLLIPCYLGWLILNLQDKEDRFNVLCSAEECFKEFLDQMKLYEANCDKAVTSESSSQTVAGSGVQKGRDALIKRHKEKAKLKEKISILEKKQTSTDFDSVDEEIIRELYLSQLKLWTWRSEEELLAIQREKPMAEHMMKLKSGAESQQSSSLSRQPNGERKALKPVIITRSELQKQVFGAGYPSLPTMTVSEWYDQLVRSGRMPENGGGTSSCNGANAEEFEAEKAAESDDAAWLKKARDWDDYKDDHRRGWGNTKNKG